MTVSVWLGTRLICKDRMWLSGTKSLLQLSCNFDITMRRFSMRKFAVVVFVLEALLLSTPPHSLADTPITGFRGQIENVRWTPPPANVKTLAPGHDMDLVRMGRWGQNFLVNNTNPKLNYACRFGIDVWSCPPLKLQEDLVANGDTDCRMDWEFMNMAEMCGVGQTADAAAGVRRRILSYLGKDDLAHVPGALYCGGVPGDKIYISPWTTGKILVSLAETFARQDDQAAKQRARQVFVALRKLASWNGDRAWYRGGSGPYLDGKWYDTFVTVSYGCQTEPVLRYGLLTGDREAIDFAKALARARSTACRRT